MLLHNLLRWEIIRQYSFSKCHQDAVATVEGEGVSKETCSIMSTNEIIDRIERLAVRRGKKRSLMALVHEILKVVYYVFNDKCEYIELGKNFVDDRRNLSQIKYHKEALINFGVDLSDTQSA